MTPDPAPVAMMLPTYPALNDKPLPPPPPRRSSLSRHSTVLLATASPSPSPSSASPASSASSSAPPSPPIPNALAQQQQEQPTVEGGATSTLPPDADPIICPVETDNKVENRLAKAAEVFDKVSAVADQVDAVSSGLGGAKVVAEFLESVVSALPMGQVVCKCFSIMYEAQQTAQGNADLASTLFDRVTFVLNTLRTLYSIGKWKVSTAPQVLTTISTVTQDCSKFFLAYRAKSWFQKRFYGSDIRNSFTSLDSRLSAALSDLQLVLQIETVARLEPPAPSQLASREDVIADRFIATHGGPAAVQASPELVQQLAQAVGTKFTPKLMNDISFEFDQLESQLTAGFQKTLDAIQIVGRKVDQVQGSVDELKRRNRTYMDIKCAELRDLWAGAGWGLRVDANVFAETLVAHVKASMNMEEMEEKFDGWDQYTLDTVVDYWADSLEFLDYDGTSEVSVEELNSGFPFDMPLKDYFMLCTFYMDNYVRESIETPVSTIRSVIHSIRTMPVGTPFYTFFHQLVPHLRSLSDYCYMHMDSHMRELDEDVYQACLQYAQECLERECELHWANKEDEFEESKADFTNYFTSSATNWIDYGLGGVMDELTEIINQVTGHEDESEDDDELQADEEEDEEEEKEEEAEDEGQDQDQEEAVEVVDEQDVQDGDEYEDVSDEEEEEQEEEGKTASTWDRLKQCVLNLRSLTKKFDEHVVTRFGDTAAEGESWYGYLATLGSDDWTYRVDFCNADFNVPYALASWMPLINDSTLPENAIVGGLLDGQPVYVARAHVLRGIATDVVPTFAYKDVKSGEWIAHAACKGVHTARKIEWLVRGRNVHVPSTVDEPANRVLEWHQTTLEEAPHPLAGAAGLEYLSHETWAVRHRFSPTTILPGKLVAVHGQLHASFAYPQPDGTVVEYSTFVAADQETPTRKHLPRTIQLEILLGDKDNVAFFDHFEWLTPEDLQAANNFKPVILGGSSSQPVYLSWVVADHGVRTGAVVHGEEVALYGARPIRDRTSTHAYRVLAAKVSSATDARVSRASKVFTEHEPSVYNPHDLLRWRPYYSDSKLGDKAKSFERMVNVGGRLRADTFVVRRLIHKVVEGKPELGPQSFCVGQLLVADGEPLCHLTFDDSHNETDLEQLEVLTFSLAGYEHEYNCAPSDDELCVMYWYKDGVEDDNGVMTGNHVMHLSPQTHS